MSWNVSLEDSEGRAVEVELFSEGGTYALGGITQAELNITYNYSSSYYKTINAEDGLRWLDGKKAKDTLRVLIDAVDLLGTNRDNDYRKATNGNAGYALSILVDWAKQYPKAIFRVS